MENDDDFDYSQPLKPTNQHQEVELTREEKMAKYFEEAKQKSDVILVEAGLLEDSIVQDEPNNKDNNEPTNIFDFIIGLIKNSPVIRNLIKETIIENGLIKLPYPFRSKMPVGVCNKVALFNANNIIRKITKNLDDNKSEIDSYRFKDIVETTLKEDLEDSVAEDLTFEIMDQLALKIPSNARTRKSSLATKSIGGSSKFIYKS